MHKVLIPALLLLALGACETVKGAGQDIQAGGAVVSREAAHTQAQM
ncbi:entericidin A/B family lipoprotein [Paenirhodobacter populi]|uniref:Entericidin A/B family lipoprotein n=1 Tax=Paenirhodobacter populi TaxID=2306993 RepID=A0A443KBD9_9RHOB|nr:entericidin A/B family lipoprotein [Sinirhodobacter populi]RWR08792.1 entericidin A/B family lipoprotein [Sinirhodobacter populi]RWR12669.1 entericidin A/B family lipoprotein [Sinirhodobacter populi]RWR22488.1 entericidin A/B family lipoprotein [Sinirhodobacter populi]RWR30055.1 entericidin A/B family lipoprotein [Sinirhodobacter populi]RWR31824.1 entericidin A/B family lipoprotein [Sinirhodobacter populi]